MDRFLCNVSVFYLCKMNTPVFSLEKEEKGLDYKKNFLFFFKIVHVLHFKTFSSIIIFMRCNAFLSRLVAISFPTKVISIGISNPTPIPLFILVPVTLQLAYDLGKQKNLFNVLLRKRGTCPTTSTRLK